MSSPVVVVAEDDASVRALLVLELERRGYVVHACGNGVEALEAIRRHRPHVAVLDRMMPMLDGNAVLAAVRADAMVQDTIVVMVTARADLDAINESFEHGADDYITKPFHADEVDRALRHLLAGSQ